MNKNDQKFMAQEIRSKYMEKEQDNKLENLRKMDAKVKKPAAIFAYIFGAISSLIFGTGMCFAMGVIESGTYFGLTISDDMMLQGITVGLIGMALMVINYPIYKKVLADRKTKYGGEIIRLSEEIIASQEQ